MLVQKGKSAAERFWVYTVIGLLVALMVLAGLGFLLEDIVTGRKSQAP